MAISRSQLVAELEPGLNALFGMEYDNYENEHTEIYSIESSDRAFEEEVMLSGFGEAPVKSEGAGVEYDNAQEVYTARYTHETIALAFSLTEETSLEQALIDIAAFTDERGLKIAIQGLKLIIPKELQFTADRIMKSTLRVGTADNDINAIRNMGMVPQGYTVNHFLVDPDAFFIKTDAPNGMKMFNRAAIKTGFEGDFDTGNVRYKARERYSFGFSDPRGIFGSPGTP
jgi:hypothetical protein